LFFIALFTSAFMLLMSFLNLSRSSFASRIICAGSFLNSLDVFDGLTCFLHIFGT
jgi:hypothetical protein